MASLQVRFGSVDNDRPQTALDSDYSKLKVQNVLPKPKNDEPSPSHSRMKKILLVATVLAGGVMLSQAGVSVHIGIGFPLPPPPVPIVVVPAPAPICPAPVYVAPPVCPPRFVVPCAPISYRPAYGYHGPRWQHRDWNRRAHGYGYHR